MKSNQNQIAESLVKKKMPNIVGAKYNKKYILSQKKKFYIYIILF